MKHLWKITAIVVAIAQTATSERITQESANAQVGYASWECSALVSLSESETNTALHSRLYEFGQDRLRMYLEDEVSVPKNEGIYVGPPIAFLERLDITQTTDFNLGVIWEHILSEAAANRENSLQEKHPNMRAAFAELWQEKEIRKRNCRVLGL